MPELPIQLRYITIDVFTDRAFGGNPLAVVLGADGLSPAQMQSIAAEFGYSETTFVLPARERAHTAQVRIFTPRVEVPFAGHPNIGTAVALARELEARGGPRQERLLFEESAGLVALRLLRAEGLVVGAELTAPQPLSRGATVTVEDAAACLMLPVSEVSRATHEPQVVSVGLPFLAVELTSREALRRARPDAAAHERVLPPIGTDGVYAYVRGPACAELNARMFSPLDSTVEDPATGSATAATIAHLAALQSPRDAETEWRIEQGVDMGRPSLMIGRTSKRDGVIVSVHIGGRAVPVMQGTLSLSS